METTSQRIINRLNELKTRVIEFLSKYSKIYQSIHPGDGFISLSGNHSFEKLPKDAVHIQDKIYKDFNNLMDLIDVLIVDSMTTHKKSFEKEKKILLIYIQQRGMTWQQNISEVIGSTENSFNKMVEYISSIFPSSQSFPILIPDTNALYYNTEIEKWSFDSISRFTIVLTPSVLKDLDKHKIEHRNQVVRDKALTLINKIKEYRRRGRLVDGVTIVQNKIDLTSIATEPDFSKTLAWLDKENEDDRLIAEYIEVMRKHCDRPVFLVTRDINLQNKCEVAELAYIEP